MKKISNIFSCLANCKLKPRWDVIPYNQLAKVTVPSVGKEAESLDPFSITDRNCKSQITC